MSELQFTWLKKGERTAGIDPLLKVTGLSVRLGIRRVFEGIDLEVYEGDHVLVTGPNGCGKSTLLNAIMGVLPGLIISGLIEFRSQNITRLPTHERAQLGIAYMRQRDNVFSGLSVVDNLRMALGGDEAERFRQQLPQWASELRMEKMAGALSGGERQKLAYAMSCRYKVNLLLADEPDAGVSNWAGIQNQNSYIMISHGI